MTTSRADGLHRGGRALTALSMHQTGTVLPYDWLRCHSEVNVSISANEARQRFYPLIRQVNEDHEPIEVTSREHGDIVIMSAEDFRSWQETVYLLRSPRNAQILMESIAELDAGHGQARELIETENEEGPAA